MVAGLVTGVRWWRCRVVSGVGRTAVHEDLVAGVDQSVEQ